MITPEQATKIREELHRRRNLLETRLTALRDKKSFSRKRSSSNSSAAQGISKIPKTIGTKVSFSAASNRAPTEREIREAIRIAKRVGLTDEQLKEIGL